RCLLSAGPSSSDAILFDVVRPGSDHHALRPERRGAAASGPQAAQVRALYRTYLHQKPGAADLRRAVAFLAGGGTPGQLEARVPGSAAYFQTRARRKNARFLPAR